MSELTVDWKQKFARAICEELNKINTGRDVTIEDIYGFEYLSNHQLESLLLHVRRTAQYAHRCRGMGNGYGVNVAIIWKYHIQKLFEIKNIKINIFEDRDVYTYVTIVWNDSKSLTHKQILQYEGLSNEEIVTSFEDQIKKTKKEIKLKYLENELEDSYK